MKKHFNDLVLIIFIFLLFVGKFLMYMHKLSIPTFSIILSIFGVIFLFFVLYNYKKNNFEFKLSDILILILLIIALFSTLFSYDVKISFFGQSWRAEGLLVFFTYYMLFIFSTFIKNENKNKIINSILLIGVIQVIIGILQINNIIVSTYDGTPFAKGFNANSTLFGSEMVLCFGLASGLFLRNKNIKYIFFTLVSLIGVIISGSMATFVGTASIILFELFYIIKFKQIKFLLKISLPIIIFFISFLFIFNACFNNKLVSDIKTLTHETYDILINHKVSNNYGTKRIFIWKYSAKLVPKYAFRGIGLDCFMYAFPQEKVREELKMNAIVDKAHNELLQLSITEGILAPIVYVILFIYSICRKDKNDNYMPLKASIFGYFIQSLFTISTITVAPLFYIVYGLCNSKDDNYETIS